MEKFVSPCPAPTDRECEIVTILIEEAAEVQQRATKLLRFGIAEIQPGQQLSNAQRLGLEIGDFFEMVELAVEAGIVDRESISIGRVGKKRQLAKFMQTAEPRCAQCGMVGRFIGACSGGGDRCAMLHPETAI